MYESEIPTGAEPTAPPPSAPPMEPGAPPPKDDMVPDYGAWPVFRRASVASTVQVLACLSVAVAVGVGRDIQTDCFVVGQCGRCGRGQISRGACGRRRR